jgi:hypothetical protein
MNQADGFDCPSCAWPDPDPEHRKAAEFRENGAEAVSWAATRKRHEFLERYCDGLEAAKAHW